jgi:hypothetical protein
VIYLNYNWIKNCGCHHPTTRKYKILDKATKIIAKTLFCNLEFDLKMTLRLTIKICTISASSIDSHVLFKATKSMFDPHSTPKISTVNLIVFGQTDIAIGSMCAYGETWEAKGIFTKNQNFFWRKFVFWEKI